MARSKSPAPRRRVDENLKSIGKSNGKSNGKSSGNGSHHRVTIEYEEKELEEKLEGEMKENVEEENGDSIQQSNLTIKHKNNNDDDVEEHFCFDIISGDLHLKKSDNLKDFIWVMNDEPHASRRKRLIKEYPEIAKLMGHEPRTKWIMTFLVILQLSLAYYLRNDALYGGTLKFWVISYVVGATITQALFLGVHEISHNLAFKSFKANKIFGIFANIPMVLPFFVAFKHYHNEHHKNQGVENVDTDLPTELEAKYLSSPFGKFFFLFNQTWFYALRPVLTRPQKLTSWHLVNLLTQVSFVFLTVYNFGWGPILYLVACAHLAGSIHPMASHFIAEHYSFAGEVETASYYGPLNMLAFNVGYHNEHHDFPLVAWSKLPELRKFGDYDTLPRHESWPKVLIEFLFNPAITLHNRVKRHDKNGIGKAPGATGTADYLGNWWTDGSSEAAKSKAD